MNKKEEILEATFYYFSKNGYYASMSDIARKVDLKTPSLYSHFENKDQIIYLTIERELNRFFSYFDQIIQSMDGLNVGQQLEKIILSIYEYYKTIERLRFKRNIALICNEELRAKCRDLILSKERDFSIQVIQIFEQGISSGELRADADDSITFLYFAMIQGLLDSMLLYWESPDEMEGYIMKTWKAYWNGIKKQT